MCGSEVLLVLPVPQRGGVFWDSRYPAELGGPCWALRRPLVEPSESAGPPAPWFLRSVVLRSRHLIGLLCLVLLQWIFVSLFIPTLPPWCRLGIFVPIFGYSGATLRRVFLPSRPLGFVCVALSRGSA